MTASASDSKDLSPFRATSPDERFVRTERILGKGTTKIVYQARDEDEGVDVAWNEIDVTRASDSALQRIRNEVHILEMLEPHPNIVTLIHSWENLDDGCFVFITEMVPGGTLKNFIAEAKNRRLKIKVVKRICKQVLQGLHYLHTRPIPIVHRDLKCDNIFIDAHNCAIKIGDFGLSGSTTTLQYGRISRLEFMPPEALRNENVYNTKGDVYAAGMCVIEMVTGHYPYEECNQDVCAIRNKVLKGIEPEILSDIDELTYTNLTSGSTVINLIQCALQPYELRPTATELLEHPFLTEELIASPTITTNSNVGTSQSQWVRSPKKGTVIINNCYSGSSICFDAPHVESLTFSIDNSSSHSNSSPEFDGQTVQLQNLDEEEVKEEVMLNSPSKHKLFEEELMIKALLEQETLNYNKWRSNLIEKVKRVEIELQKLEQKET